MLKPIDILLCILTFMITWFAATILNPYNLEVELARMELSVARFFVFGFIIFVLIFIRDEFNG